MRQHLIAVLGLAAVVGTSGLALAQDRGGDRPERPNREQRERGDRGDRAERGERGPRAERGQRGERGDRGDMQARMAERMKEQMKVSDEEWAVLQPKLAKVMEAQRASRGGMMGGFGRGRGGPDGGAQAETPLAKASSELRQTLEKEDASANEIKERLAAVREARKQAEENLKAAREDLRSVLTPRQEAALVVVGMLD